MSDVAIAPPPAGAPTSNAPTNTPSNTRGEVVIDQNPVNSPTPVGSQAPPVPPTQKPSGRPESRRESIQRAFDKARADNPPKPREAKKGDNGPPEDTPDEKFSLKKRPVAGDQPRERGRFAPKSAPNVSPQESADAGRQAPAQPGQQAAPHQQLPQGVPYRDPPQRMAEHAKADWSKAPESVRGEVHRMQHEFGRAYQAYRHDHEAMNEVRQYHDLARQQGTTLGKVMGNYTGMERKLREDPIGGLDVLVHNLNLRSPEGQKLTLRDVAWHVLNQSPEQQKLVQQQNGQTALTHQLGQLHQMVNSLAQQNQQMQYERRFGQTRSALDRYADAHPRFDELGPLIEREIKLGFNLDQAYRRAELLSPATHAAQTRNGSPAAQTRTPDRSISGSPDRGTNGSARRPGTKPVGRRDAIANAIRRVNGAL